MQNIKTFFLLLFFSKTMVLTPNPVTIPVEGLEIPLKESISAITAGASIQIEISSILNIEGKFSLLQALRDIKQHFPKGGIKAVLSNDKGENVTLVYQGRSLLNSKHQYLSLSGDVPTDVKWNKLKIYTQIELSDITILWKNSKH